jgi:hypothetical protein
MTVTLTYYQFFDSVHDCTLKNKTILGTLKILCIPASSFCQWMKVELTLMKWGTSKRRGQ